VPRPRAHIDTARLADAFAADGLHGTSSAAVAAIVGVAKPTLYAHGVTKDELFLHAVQSEVERVLARLAAAERRAAGRSARHRATAAAEALIEHATARPDGARLLTHTAAHASSRVADQVTAAVRRITTYVEAGLRRELAADRLDPALAPWLARGLVAAAWSVGAPRAGERRPARGTLASSVASIVPETRAPQARSWPTA
jgi:AcrR family transcriptional regulator